MRPQVLHIIPFLWSGAGSVVTRLCEEQRRHGPIAIVTAGVSRDLSDWRRYRRRLSAAGVAHHTIDFFHRDEGRFWQGVLELETLMRHLRPAVVHAHAGVPTAAAVVARASVGSKARVIGQMYSWGLNRPGWMDRQDTWGFSQADRVVCSAHAYSAALRNAGVPARRLLYLPWGLPLEELPRRGDLRTPRRHGPVIGFVGRIEPRKGQANLVQAIGVLRRALPDARLELVGPIADEAYAASIRQLIRDVGLAEAVSMPGEVRSPVAFVRRWDLFVSLSSDEGQGLAVLEAMAIGVPVLARPVAGIADFLRDGRTGFWSTARTAQGLAREMKAVLDSPRRQSVSHNARRLVEQGYSWATTVRAFDRLYWAR